MTAPSLQRIPTPEQALRQLSKLEEAIFSNSYQSKQFLGQM